MKQRLSLFMLLCLTALAAHSAPTYYLNENFESGSIPTTWTQQVMSDVSCMWIIDTLATNPAGAHSGSYRVALRNTTGSTKGYVTRLITPAMLFPAGSAYQLSFAYANALKSNQFFDFLKVYYSTDGTKWNRLDTVSTPVYHNGWEVMTIDLIGAAGQNAYQIAFEANEQDGHGVVLDDIKVMKKSTCFDVENFGAIAKNTSATIYYQKQGTVQLLVDTVQHNMATFDPTTAQVVYYAQTTDHEVELTGLTPLTKYYAYIRSICDDNESGFTNWVSMNFTTSLAYPYAESFSSGIPASWQNLYGQIGQEPTTNPSTSTYYYKWLYTNNISVLGAAHVFATPYYTYSAGYIPTWLVSPAIDLTNVTDEAVELKFRFAMTASSTGTSEVSSKEDYSFHVLIASDGGTSWVGAKQITYLGTELNATERKIRIDLSEYKGEVIKVALVADGSGTGAFFHVANLSIDAFDKQCGDVSRVFISDLTDVAAKINWEISGKDSVMVQWSKVSTFTTIMDSVKIAPANHQYLLSGLDNSTTYYVRVKQLCADASYVNTSFQTGRGLPFVPTFSSETLPAGWMRLSGTSSQLFNDSAQTTTSGWTLGGSYRSVWTPEYYPNCEIYSTTYNYWLTSPAVYLNPAVADHARLTFDMALTYWNSSSQAATSSDDRIWVVISEDGGQTWSRQNATLWSGNAADTPDYDYNAIPATGTSYTVDLTAYMGKTIKFAFGVETPVSGTDNRVHVHNIALKAFDPNCAGLSKFVFNAGITSATVKWTYQGTQSAVVQRALNAAFTDSVENTVTGVDSIVYQGLEPNTTYFFRAKQNCEMGEWSNAMSFTTHCQPDTIPYIYGFEDADAISCWTLIQDGQSYPKVSATSSYARTGTHSLIWGTGYTGSATISYAALPAFTSAVNLLEMTFYMRDASASYKGDTIEIGVMTNPTNPNTFVKVGQAIAAANTYEQFNIGFNNYHGNGQYIAFKRLIGKKAAVYIDDIDVHFLPNCYRMGDVQVSNITASGASLRFDQTNADNFQIVLATEYINPDTLDQVAAEKIVYNQTVAYQSSIAVTSAAIQPNTAYYVYVRGVCSEQDKGLWSNMVSFTTACAAIDVDSYGVETFTDIATITCWKMGFLNAASGSDATAERVVNNAYGAHIELAKKAVSGTDDAYAISPELDVDSIKKYQVTFSAATFKQEATNHARLEIGVITDPSDLDTYKPIETLTLNYAADSTAEKVYVVDFSTYTSDIYGDCGKFVMFKSPAGTDSTNYVLIDNVSFQVAATCPQILTTSVDNIGLNSATFHFKKTDATQYEVMVSTINSIKADTISSYVQRSIVTDNNVAITGLNASTQYYAYVRAICGVGDTANWSASCAFQTKFGVPYNESFDGTVINGWSIYSSSAFSSADSILGSSFAAVSSNYTWSLVAAASSSFASGLEGNVARSYIPWTNGSNMWLVGPTIDMTAQAGQNVQLSFKVARSDVSYDGTEAAASSDCSGYKFYVVVSTDDGVTWKKANATSWLTDGSGDNDYKALNGTAQEVKIGLSQYAGKSIRVAFYTESNGSPYKYNYIFVDNVKIYTYEAVCQGAKKLQVETSGLTAKATWEIEGLPAKSIVELSNISDFATIISSDTLDGVFEKNFSGLNLSTTYYVRVKQAECEDAEWQVKSFKTPLGIPYNETFNSSSISADWSIMSGSVSSAFAGTNPTASSGGWVIATNSNGLPANHARINIYNSSSNKWLVSPTINMSNVEMGSLVHFTFDFAYTGYNKAAAPTATGLNQGLLVLVSLDEGATWTRANSWEWSQSDTTAAVVYSLSSISATGTPIVLDFSQFAGQSVKVAFVAISTSGDNDFHIANVNLGKIDMTCLAPTDLIVLDPQTHQAGLSWAGDSAKVTIVEYATSGDFTQGLLRDTVASGLSHTLTNLASGTAYYARVHQICSATDKTGNSNIVNFLTACEAKTITKDAPYVMNFDNETAGEGTLPVCWNIDRAGSKYPYIYSYSYYAHSGNNMLYFGGSSGSSSTQYVILPEVTNNANELQLNFYLQGYSSYYPEYNDSIIVGVMSDPADPTTFVAVKGFQNQTGSYQECEVWFNNYTGNGHYVALKRVPVAYVGSYSTSYYGSYLDDITLAKLPSCYKIEGLAASALSHSAVISHKASNAGQYELIVASKAINPDTVATVADSLIAYHQTASDTAVTVSALMANTKYYVYLRGVCGSDDQGAWATTTFLTMCDAATITADAPYIMDFEDENTGALPGCWTAIKNGATYPSVSYGSYNAHAGSQFLNFGGSYGDEVVTYTLLPELANDINKLQMSMYVKSYSSYMDSMVIGVMSDPTDTTTFVAVKELAIENSAYEQQEIYFSSYAGAGHFIAIKHVPVAYESYYSTDYYGGYVDDIEISLIPSCSALASLEASNITRREMDINWSAKTPAENQHYDLVISKTALDNAALDTVAKLNLDTNFYHASGLDRETTYYIYARANCGVDDGAGAWLDIRVKTKSLSACDDAMVAAGTSTTEYCPVYGYNADAAQKTQSLYAASMLTELVGNSISGLTYYVFSGTNSSKWDNSEFVIRMGVTEEADLSEDFVADLEEVYRGTLTANTTDNMVITLDAPFEYTGGNLVIEFEQPAKSGYARVYFVSMANTASISRYQYGTYSSYTSTQLPKVSFQYCYSVDPCPAVDSIGHELTGEGINTARIFWKAGAGDYANTYDLLISDTAVIDFSAVVATYDSIAALSYNVSGLEAYTDYYVYVRVNCDAESKADGRSGWSEAYSFKTNSACRVVTDLDIVPTGKTSALATWKAAGQDPNFQYVLSNVAMSKEELEVAIPTASALTDTFAVLSGLTSGQKYFIYVANSCGEEGRSPYVGDSVLIPDACPAVANLQASYVAFNAVSLEWNRGAFAEENTWLVGIEGMSRDQQIMDSSFTFIGLEADTTYTFFVKAVCGESEMSKAEVMIIHTPERPTGEITIGTPAGSDYNTPFNTNYKNAWDQMIYSSATVGQSGTISSVAYHCAGVAYTPLTDTQTRIYMGHTSKDIAESTTDWVAMENLTLVLNMQSFAQPTDTGWVVLQLQTPFEYNGNDNLVIVVSSIRGSYASAQKYYYSLGTNGVTMYRQNDSDAQYAEHPGTNTGIRSTYLPNIRLGFEAAACNKVVRLEAKNITTSSVDLSWFPGDAEMSWAVINSETALPAAMLDTMAYEVVNELKKSYTGLYADWDYHFYIRSLCSTTEFSDWKELAYRTAPTCLVPANLIADSLSFDAAHLVWTEMNEGFSGNYTIAFGLKSTFNLAVDSTYTLLSSTEPAILITGLSSVTEYSFAVRSNCGEDDLSRWSQVASFRTECGAVTITNDYNYVMDFENETDSLPTCWSAIRNGTTYPMVVSGSYSAHQGANYFSFGGYSGPNKTLYAALPEISNDINTLRIKFWMAGYAYSATYKNDSVLVGVMTDPEDASTFVVVDRFQAVEDDWAEYEVHFDTYTGDGHYIAFKRIPMASGSYSSSYYGSYLDDITVSFLPTCTKPTALMATAMIDTALVSWTGSSESYIVEYSEDNTFSTVDTVLCADTAIVLRGLKPSTTYYVRATGVCEDATSDVSAAISFSTKQGLPFVENFDASTSIPNLWKRYTGDLFNNPSSSSYYGWSITSTQSGGMLPNHAYCSVALEEDSWSYYDENLMYAMVTPEIMMNADTNAIVQLSFDLALTAANGVDTPAVADVKDRAFYIVISNDGGKTWKSTNAYSWKDNGTMGSYSNIPTTSTHYEIDLSTWIGKSITLAFFHSSGTSTSTAYTVIHLDNVKIAEVNPNCLGVKNIQVSDVSFSGAKVDFNYKAGNHDAVLALSKNAVLNLEDVVLLDTIHNDSTYLLPGLDASTAYYVFVEQLCAEGETSAWESASFQTAYGLRFAPQFKSSLPSDWKLYKGYADDVFADPSNLVAYTAGWSVVAADTASLNVNHLRSEIYYNWNYWVMTPQIDLTPNIGQGILLNFDAALTPYSSSSREKMYTGTDDKFMVVISEDGGKTWKKSNATIWANDSTGDYSLNAIAEHGTHYTINMSQYAGKVIQIAFHQESTVSNTDNYIHVGNIVLDKVDNAINYIGDVCEGEDYDGTLEDNPFKVAHTDYQVGLNVYSKYMPADPAVAESVDTILILNLLVSQHSTYEYEAIVCEGEHYQDAFFEFDVKLTTPTTQRKTGMKNIAGCDSTIIMHLTINPIQREDIFAVTCEGTPYHFGGKDIYQPGTYYDTLSSVLTGCDSIAILHLSFDKPSEMTKDIILCHGDSLVLSDGKVITEPGEYIEVITKSSGCDSTIYWTVLVADEMGVARDTIDITELPYVFNNQILLESGTQAGSHDVTVGMSCGDGILRILVENKTGLKELFDKQDTIDKAIIDNQLIIFRNGKKYNAQGAEL